MYVCTYHTRLIDIHGRWQALLGRQRGILQRFATRAELVEEKYVRGTNELEQA